MKKIMSLVCATAALISGLQAFQSEVNVPFEPLTHTAFKVIEQNPDGTPKKMHLYLYQEDAVYGITKSTDRCDQVSDDGAVTFVAYDVLSIKAHEGNPGFHRATCDYTIYLSSEEVKDGYFMAYILGNDILHKLTFIKFETLRHGPAESDQESGSSGCYLL